jgi:hypothetical protein
VPQIMFHISSSLLSYLELPFCNACVFDYSRQCPLGTGAVNVHEPDLVFVVAHPIPRVRW